MEEKIPDTPAKPPIPPPQGFVSMDLETTGTEVPCDIIQASAVVYEGNPLIEKDNTNMCIRPGMHMPPACIAVHGISNEIAATYPTKEEQIPELHRKMKHLAHTHVFIGYNLVKYDIPVMDDCFRRETLPTMAYRYRPLDGMLLAQKMFDDEVTGNYKLDTIFLHLFPERLEEWKTMRGTHNALTDCRMTFDVIQRMIHILREEGKKTSLRALYSMIDTPKLITKWPMTKEKGKLIEDLVRSDNWAVGWFMKRADMVADRPDLAFTIRSIWAKMKAERIAANSAAGPSLGPKIT